MIIIVWPQSIHSHVRIANIVQDVPKKAI